MHDCNSLHCRSQVPKLALRRSARMDSFSVTTWDVFPPYGDAMMMMTALTTAMRRTAVSSVYSHWHTHVCVWEQQPCITRCQNQPSHQSITSLFECLLSISNNNWLASKAIINYFKSLLKLFSCLRIGVIGDCSCHSLHSEYLLNVDSCKCRDMYTIHTSLQMFGVSKIL